MGCLKSKHKYGVSNAKATEQKNSDKAQEAALGDSQLQESQGQVDSALVDFAQNLSEEIIQTVISQLADIEQRYIDIPYIESEVL